MFTNYQNLGLLTSEEEPEGDSEKEEYDSDNELYPCVDPVEKVKELFEEAQGQPSLNKDQCLLVTERQPRTPRKDSCFPNLAEVTSNPSPYLLHKNMGIPGNSFPLSNICVNSTFISPVSLIEKGKGGSTSNAQNSPPMLGHNLNNSECLGDISCSGKPHTNFCEQIGGGEEVNIDTLSNCFSKEEWMKISDLLNNLNLTLVPIHNKTRKVTRNEALVLDKEVPEEDKLEIFPSELEKSKPLSDKIERGNSLRYVYGSWVEFVNQGKIENFLLLMQQAL
ncbi:hypothetical protein LguiB_006546 [Lonicera macranthoides]